LLTEERLQKVDSGVRKSFKDRRENLAVRDSADWPNESTFARLLRLLHIACVN